MPAKGTGARQREVEVEYGEPFWDVVAGYAAAGESASATAVILGYGNHSAFLRLLQRNGKSHLFKPAQQTNGMLSSRESRRGVCTPAMAAALQQAALANPSYKRNQYGQKTPASVQEVRGAALPAVDD